MDSFTNSINKYSYNKILEDTNKAEDRLKKYDQVLVEEKTNSQAKSLPAIWIIWWAFGMWGGHRFYMNRKDAPYMLILTLFACLLIICSFASVKVIFSGIIMLAVMLVWKLIDAFFLNRWIKFNRLDVKRKLVKKYQND